MCKQVIAIHFGCFFYFSKIAQNNLELCLKQTVKLTMEQKFWFESALKYEQYILVQLRSLKLPFWGEECYCLQEIVSFSS